MTKAETQSPAPPNIRYFAMGLQRLGMRARQVLSATPSRHGPIQKRVTAAEFGERLEEVTHDVAEAHTALNRVIADCFQRNADKMHEDRLDSAFVDSFLDGIQDFVEVIRRHRRWAVGVRTDDVTEAVRVKLVHFLNAQLEQFAECAADTSAQFRQPPRPGTKCVRVAVGFDIEEEAQQLLEAMAEARETLQRRAAHAQPKPRRSWAWASWTLLFMTFIVAGLMKIAFEHKRPRRNG